MVYISSSERSHKDLISLSNWPIYISGYDIPLLHWSHIKSYKWMLILGFYTFNLKHFKRQQIKNYGFGEGISFTAFLPLSAHQFSTEAIHGRVCSSMVAGHQ